MTHGNFRGFQNLGHNNEGSQNLSLYQGVRHIQLPSVASRGQLVSSPLFTGKIQALPA